MSVRTSVKGGLNFIIDAAAVMYALIQGTDTPKPPKTRTRPNVTFSDIDFLMKYVEKPLDINTDEESRYRRLRDLGLMQPREDLLPFQRYSLTREGLSFLSDWRINRGRGI